MSRSASPADFSAMRAIVWVAIYLCAGNADGFASEVRERFDGRVASHPKRHDRKVAFGCNKDEIAAGEHCRDRRWSR